MAKAKTSNLDLMALDARNCLRDGRLQDAAAWYHKILAIQAQNHAGLFNLAQVLHELGQEDEFRQFEKRFLALKPGAADIEIRKGAYLYARGKFSEAIACYQAASDMGHKSLELYTGWGEAYFDNGNPEKAIECYEKAPKRFSNDAALWALTAGARYALAQYQEAIDNARKALALNSDLVSAKCLIAWSYLMLGDYEKGLPLHEERLAYNSRELLSKIGMPTNLDQFTDKPRWRGEDLTGKTLLIWTEQGLGDSIMMMRYIPLLAAKGASACIVYCQPSLVKTMLTVTPLVVDTQKTVDSSLFDVHCSAMSLPFCFGTRIESIPASVPYLKVDSSVKNIWSEQLRRFPGLKVGVAWAGSRALGQDHLRSIAFARLAPLFDVPGTQFVSLQKDAAAVSALFSSHLILDWMPASGDLMDTASLISQLDLVITVDTVIAHLAGALGKPVWLLNRFESEWRWMKDRIDSPWYPSTRIFRQPVMHDWDSPIQNIAAELAELAKAQSGQILELAEWQNAANNANRALGIASAQSVESGGWRQKLTSLWKR